RLLGLRDRPDARGVRLLRLEGRVAGIAVGRAEIDRRARLPDLRAAERDQVADDRAGDEPRDGKPPADDDRTRVTTEVDLLLGLEVGLADARTHEAATLFAAHSHCACKPSSSAIAACHPSSRSMRVVSGAVRRISPSAAGRSTSSSLLPDTSSAVPIASCIVASVAPPTLSSRPLPL